MMADDIKLTDCLTHAGQLCWDCANAYGGCPWTAVDPVPTVHISSSKYGNTESYRIRGCPLFVQEERHGEAGD